MKRFSIAFISIILFFICQVEGQNSCIKRQSQVSEISDTSTSSTLYQKCWYINVPQDKYIRLQVTKLKIPEAQRCYQSYLNIFVNETKETYYYCLMDSSVWLPVTALSDVNITFSIYGSWYGFEKYYEGSFKLKYHIEDLTCAQKKHFRCDKYSCIHGSQVCDGIEDCARGIDEIGCERGVLAVKGVNVSRENVIKWLTNQRSASFGWGKNTHRAITALFLTKAVSFQGDDLDAELMAKQLELQTSVTLLRNSSEPLTVSELSMFVNALTATCHNPREFYGYDLLQILSERVAILKTPCPGAYLTLCNSNWTISSPDVQKLLKLLHGPQGYPFHLDHDISDVRNKLGSKMRVHYSLYVGDQKDVVHTIYLRMPDDSTAYDVMRVAQLEDPKFKFLYRDASGYMYVYEIAGITNDPEAGKFWLLYSKSESTEEKIEHYTQSPDKFILKDEDHLIMWYKTAHM